jgi:hypothetical protein
MAVSNNIGLFIHGGAVRGVYKPPFIHDRAFDGTNNTKTQNDRAENDGVTNDVFTGAAGIRDRPDGAPDVAGKAVRGWDVPSGAEET